MAENNNNKLDNGTVRDKIVLFLRDGKPKHFTDITKGLTKHDFTINRELKILIDNNWILKTGKKPKTLYSLDLTRHYVQEYLKHADVAIPDNSNINEIPLDYEKLSDPDQQEFLDYLLGIDRIKNQEVKNDTQDATEVTKPEPKSAAESILAELEKNRLTEQAQEEVVKNTNVLLVTDKNSKLRINSSFDKPMYRALVILMEAIVEKPHDKPFKLVITYNPKKD